MYVEYKFIFGLLLFFIFTKVTKSLNFCFNASFEGFRLNATVLQTTNVSSRMHCIVSCIQYPCCRSLNYKDRSNCGKQGECEMLHDIAHNTSKPLEINSSYDYVFINEPIKEYNAECIPKESSSEMTENTVWKNCVDIYESGERKDGIYIIDPDGQGSFEVKCLMTLDEGGWTVIQRRQDGSEDFYRNWTAYKDGFGNLTSEFWLGLDKIHRLTSSGENTMRIDMTSWDDKEYFVEYGSFSILDEADEYQLNIASYTAGDAGDYAMDYHNEKKFYTTDNDNQFNCALSYKGGWWYYSHNSCANTNPNGPYEKTEHGLFWKYIGRNGVQTGYPKTFQMAVKKSPQLVSSHHMATG